MSTQRGGFTQAWVVLSAAAVLALAIIVLSVNAIRPAFERWNIAREAAPVQERSEALSPRTRVFTSEEVAALERERAVAVRPRMLSDPAEFFGADAYPIAALRAEEQGRTVALLTVNWDGGVRSCAILSGSGSAALDDATCRHAERLRFDPARNARGTAVESDYRLPVRWQLPDA